MKIAIVGATGMVGTVMLDVLRERKIPYNELFLVASKNSVGKIISFCEKDYYVIGLDEALRKKPDIAIFSAGGETSSKSISFSWEIPEIEIRIITDDINNLFITWKLLNYFFILFNVIKRN